MAARKHPTPELLGILPLQDAVLFPNTVIPLAVVKRPGILLVEEALREGKQIGLVVLKDKDIEDPGPDDLRLVGTIGTIQKMLKVPDGTLRCIVAGGPVFGMDEFVSTEPCLTATYRDGILTIALPIAAHNRIPTVTTEIRMTVTRTLA